MNRTSANLAKQLNGKDIYTAQVEREEYFPALEELRYWGKLAIVGSLLPHEIGKKVTLLSEL